MVKGLKLNASASPPAHRRILAFFSCFFYCCGCCYSPLSGSIKLCIKISLMMFIQHRQHTLRHAQRQPQNLWQPLLPLPPSDSLFQQNWKLNVMSCFGSLSHSLFPSTDEGILVRICIHIHRRAEVMYTYLCVCVCLCKLEVLSCTKNI